MQIVECSLLHWRAQAESPLSQGPRPAFVKIFYTPCVYVQTHHPKYLESYVNKGRVNTTTITSSFMCYVFKQLIINKPAVTSQPVNNRSACGYIPIDTEKSYDLSGGRGD